MRGSTDRDIPAQVQVAVNQGGLGVHRHQQFFQLASEASRHLLITFLDVEHDFVALVVDAVPRLGQILALQGTAGLGVWSRFLAALWVGTCPPVSTITGQRRNHLARH